MLIAVYGKCIASPADLLQVVNGKYLLLIIFILDGHERDTDH